jgi:NAD(P)-dependent dehydrogenase (short-subunit alcohol dehydrogenase family)
MQPRESMTRREMVATGLLATPLIMGATARLARAQGNPDPSGAPYPQHAMSETKPMTPPNYPRPPFKKLPQEAPGLTSLMDPRPDHGETTYKGSGKLTGRKALITGGDSGIGRAVAIAFAREGADVAINYLPVEESDAKEVIDLIKKEGRKGVALPGDLRTHAFCKKLIADAASALGGIDILVSNAGQQVFRESIMEVTPEQMESTFKTNVFAMVYLVQEALQHLKPGASIIITGSIVAYDPSEGILDYSMTKACNVNFVKGLNKQLAPKGIRVNGVAPGPIWTPLQPSGGQSMEKLAKFGEDTPFGRPGQPAELAATYVLLACNDSSYVSGEVHGVTGGHPTA